MRHSSARGSAANGRAARAMHPYRLKSRTRDPIVDRVLVEATAAAAAAEAFHLLFLQRVPRSCTIVYERMDMHKHFNHFEEIGLFQRKYRMERPTLNKLVRVLAPFLERDEEFGALKTSAGALEPERIVAIGISFVAGSSYLDLLGLYGVSQPAVFDAVWNFVDAISLCPAVGPFGFSKTEEACENFAYDWRDVGEGLMDKLTAAADGLLVRSKAPSFNDTPNVIRHYSGNKKFYGLNVQGTCARNLRFVGMAAHAPGATNDSVAWQRSKMSTATEKLPTGFFLIGDNAYANTEHMMTPYAVRNQSVEKGSYNFVLCQCRIRVEQAFGMLVGRFGLLWRPLRMGYDKQTSVIRAIFHLHNFCQDENVTPVMECEDASSSRRPKANN